MKLQPCALTKTDVSKKKYFYKSVTNLCIANSYEKNSHKMWNTTRTRQARLTWTLIQTITKYIYI